MAESSPILTNFTSGELSPRLNGRIDMEKYYNGASKLSNFAVLMHGGLQKRSGTKFIREIKTSTGSNSGARLISFVFSKTQAYILEFGIVKARGIGSVCLNSKRISENSEKPREANLKEYE